MASEGEWGRRRGGGGREERRKEGEEEGEEKWEREEEGERRTGGSVGVTVRGVGRVRREGRTSDVNMLPIMKLRSEGCLCTMNC